MLECQKTKVLTQKRWVLTVGPLSIKLCFFALKIQCQTSSRNPKKLFFLNLSSMLLVLRLLSLKSLYELFHKTFYVNLLHLQKNSSWVTLNIWIQCLLRGMIATLNVLDVPNVPSRSTTYALALIFFRILYGPYFVVYNLLYVPNGNLSFHKNIITMLPSSNGYSLECLSVTFLYLALFSFNLCLTSACTFCTC